MASSSAPVLHWLASRGVDSKVFATTARTCSSPTLESPPRLRKMIRQRSASAWLVS